MIPKMVMRICAAVEAPYTHEEKKATYVGDRKALRPHFKKLKDVTTVFVLAKRLQRRL